MQHRLYALAVMLATAISTLAQHMLENFPDDGLDWTVDAFVVSDLWVANLVPRRSPQLLLSPNRKNKP